MVLCASAHTFCDQKHFSMFQNIIIPCILCTNKVLVIAIKYSHCFHIFLIRSSDRRHSYPIITRVNVKKLKCFNQP